MTAEQCKAFGFISALKAEHDDRIHIEGFRPSSGPEVFLLPDDEGNVHLVFQLDPCSPLGEMLAKYVVPFAVPSDFHFDKASLWVYRVGGENVRLEIRFPSVRRFSGSDDAHPTEEIVGLQAKVSDVHFLHAV